MSVFSLRGKLPERQKSLIELSGAVFLVTLWWALVQSGMVKASILPSPVRVVTSLPELHFHDALLRNAGHSIWLNFLGYAEAVAIALPLGFIVGLFPLFRALFERYFGALRYLPLPPTIGLFILWFGISTNMKVQFLTLGIVVYLVPVVIQRIDEVQQVYVDTAKTLGATRWQRIKTVFIPDVVARVSDDIRVLIAISWTYVTITEVINQSEGGLGALASIAARQSRTDKVYALLMFIILIGFVQDKTLVWLDRKVFPHKYA